jgi:hypothetical protein
MVGGTFLTHGREYLGGIGPPLAGPPGPVLGFLMPSEWKELHANHFTATGPEWDRIRDLWEQTLSGSGFRTVDILEAVEDLCLTWEGKPDPTGQLAQMEIFLNRGRNLLRLAQSQRRADYRAGSCHECHGSGLICGLPHPEQVKNGIWEPRGLFGDRTTIAVPCICDNGARRKQGWESYLAAHGRANERFLDLAGYTRKVPNYAVLMLRYQQDRKALAELRSIEPPKAGKKKRQGSPVGKIPGGMIDGVPPAADSIGEPTAWAS